MQDWHLRKNRQDTPKNIAIKITIMTATIAVRFSKKRLGEKLMDFFVWQDTG
jgi:hypothetical protein